MKHFISLILLFFCLSLGAQTQYSIQQTPCCWDSSGTIKPVTKVVMYSAGNITERLLGFFHTTLGYKSNATAAQVTVGNARCSLDSLSGLDFEIVQICCRSVDEYIRIYTRTNTNAITWLGDFDYFMTPVAVCTPNITRYTPCFRFAPAGTDATYPLDNDWTSEYIPLEPDSIPIDFSITAASATRELAIYNITESIIVLTWDGMNVGNGFHIPAKSVLELSFPLTSILNTGSMGGDLHFHFLSDVGPAIFVDQDPHVIINMRSY